MLNRILALKQKEDSDANEEIGIATSSGEARRIERLERQFADFEATQLKQHEEIMRKLEYIASEK